MSTTAEVTARHFMTPDPAVLDASDTIATAAKLVQQHDISGAPVIGTRGEVIGVLSKTDLIRHVLGWADQQAPRSLIETVDEEPSAETIPGEARAVLVGDVMNPDPVTGFADEALQAIAIRMSEAGVHRAIIVDKSNCPIGVVTTMDLLRAFTALDSPGAASA